MTPCPSAKDCPMIPWVDATTPLILPSSARFSFSLPSTRTLAVGGLALGALAAVGYYLWTRQTTPLPEGGATVVTSSTGTPAPDAARERANSSELDPSLRATIARIRSLVLPPDGTTPGALTSPRATLSPDYNPKDLQERRFRFEAREFANRDLTTITRESLNRFITSSETTYPLLPKAELQAIVLEYFGARGDAIRGYVAMLQDPSSLQTEIDEYIRSITAQMSSLRTLAEELRGPTGFDGTIDAAWRVSFEASKTELRLLAQICRYITGRELTAEEDRGISAIHPKSHTNLHDLKATAVYYKLSVAHSNEGTTNHEIIELLQALHEIDPSNTICSGLLTSYEAAHKENERLYQEYTRLNDQYNTLVGPGKKPHEAEANLTRELARMQGLIDAAPETIARRRETSVAFWQEILANRFPPSA